MRQEVILSVKQGGDRESLFRFDEHDTFLVGRTEFCHVNLAGDPFVSRYHFILEVNPPNARLRDLGSLNGTFVNGKKCGGRNPNLSAGQPQEEPFPQVDLASGDVISIGKTTINVSLGVESEAAPLPQIQSCNRCGAAVTTAPTELSGTPANGCEALCLSCRQSVPLPVHSRGKEPTQLEPPFIPGYDIEGQIGAGGMGVVYRAHSHKLNRRVAIKVMRSKIAMSERNRQVFLREIELLRGLDHPQIVPLLDSGSVGPLFFFVMEYCEGGSLSAFSGNFARNGGLKTAIGLGLLALEGLAYAHGQGIVHRDIKPDNVLLDKRGAKTNVRISDFGLAKSFEKAGLSGMTVTGNCGGTLLYMPPEQIASFKYCRPVSDVWSMAATIYALLCREQPREMLPGQDPIQVVLDARIVPIRERIPSLPKSVGDVLDRALAADLGVRYPTATEFRRALLAAFPSL